VAALAALIGCDPGVLGQTLDAVGPGAADPLGRRFERALQAPYHASR